MARTINMQVLVVVVGIIAAALLQGTYAVDYTVGNTTGWTDPNGASTYADWVQGKTFFVGDVLVFNFNTGAHDVARVTEANYAACSIANTLDLTTTGPARITLDSTGQHYYICTITNHCTQLQKLNITVSTGSSSPSPGSSPPPPGTVTSPPPPPPSSASSLVATFSVIFMSIVIGLLC